jgi:hypothetical protein
VPHDTYYSRQPNHEAQDLTVQIELLTQKLDTAEKKTNEYAHLGGSASYFIKRGFYDYITVTSLYADLKRYQDIVCHGCRENVFRATLAISSPPILGRRTQSASQSIGVASGRFTEPAIPLDPGATCTTMSVQMAEPSPPATFSSSGIHDCSAGIGPSARTQRSPSSSREP